MTSSYGYGVLEQALAVSAFAVGPWTTAADQCDANYYADGRSAAVQQRQRDHSGAPPPPPLTAMPAGSTAARPLAPASQRWHRRCQEATAALPAALRSGGSGSSAAHIAQLRTLWRCPAGSAVCIVAPPAAPGQHWRCIRAAPEPAAPRGSASDHVALPRGTHAPKSRENRGTSPAAREAANQRRSIPG